MLRFHKEANTPNQLSVASGHLDFQSFFLAPELMRYPHKHQVNNLTQTLVRARAQPRSMQVFTEPSLADIPGAFRGEAINYAIALATLLCGPPCCDVCVSGMRLCPGR